MFKRSAMYFGRGPFNLEASELKNPKQIVIAKSLATEIMDHNMIQTTTAKAKFINSHFYKFVSNVLKYQKAQEDAQLQYETAAKALLSGKSRVVDGRDELFAKGLMMADKWRSRVGEKNIKDVEFLKLTKLEYATHDAHPVTFIELRDLPLFNEGTNTPVYGNLTLWMALDSLFTSEKDPKVGKRYILKEIREYLQNFTEEEKTHFFDVDLKKAREVIYKRRFAEKNPSVLEKKPEEEDLTDDLSDEKKKAPEFVYVESKDSKLYSNIRKSYEKYEKEMIFRESQRMNHSVEHLGEVDMTVRTHGVKVMKDCEY